MSKLYYNKVAKYNGILCNLVDYETTLVTSEQISLNFGFIKRTRYNGEVYYYLPITPDDLESAYSVENYCEYKGDILRCSYNDRKQTFGFDMRGASKELCEKHGLGHEWYRCWVSRGYEDSQMFFEVPDSEILNVWEIHKPIDGFPFKGPEKVWVKRDGVWLR